VLEPFLGGASETAVNTAVSKVVESAVPVAKKILARFRQQPELARQAAENNQQQFLEDLFKEVERVASHAEHATTVVERLEASLSDPDYWHLVQEALHASARTGARGKHRVLARLVAERLTASADELLAQTGALAVTATRKLTPTQLRFLGLSALVTAIRPDLYPLTEPRDAFLAWYIHWLNRQASVYLPFETPAPGDYEHLRLVSCVYLAGKRDRIPVEGFHALRSSIASHLPPSRDVLAVSWMEGNREFWIQFGRSPLAEHLSHLSRNGMAGMELTSVGELIGRHVHGELIARQPTAVP